MGSNLTCQKDSLIRCIGLLSQEQREKQCCHKIPTEEGGRDKNPGITAVPLRECGGFHRISGASPIFPRSHSDRPVLSCSVFHLIPTPTEVITTGVYCDQWESILLSGCSNNQRERGGEEEEEEEGGRRKRGRGEEKGDKEEMGKRKKGKEEGRKRNNYKMNSH